MYAYSFKKCDDAVQVQALCNAAYRLTGKGVLRSHNSLWLQKNVKRRQCLDTITILFRAKCKPVNRTKKSAHQNV